MARHCCDALRSALESHCTAHPDRFDCPDALVDYDAKVDEYGLIIHDGGNSVRVITFCPWCGTRFPPSRRDQWFRELWAQGIDPQGDQVPERYLSDSWYRPA
jgi:hypothetical protein